MQCKGITTKGIRCKNISSEGYCHYHKPQLAKSGYIYIYTLQKFFDRNQKNWFVTRNLPNTHNTEWTNYQYNESPYIFVKIGMTSQPVQVRIKQWENKCKHEIKLLGPKQGPKRVVIENLHTLFKNLTLHPYKSFRDDGFYTKDISHTELEIHQQLHTCYGKGVVFCKNCSTDAYNIHIEWFLVPKNKLNNVYRLIDKLCLQRQ